ncbi:MAG: hypothetical protein WCX31_15445 [Salinivirgaceae bacterium]|jgi:hypothetical protein
MKTLDIVFPAFTYVGLSETSQVSICMIENVSDFKYKKQIKQKHDD